MSGQNYESYQKHGNTHGEPVSGVSNSISLADSDVFSGKVQDGTCFRLRCIDGSNVALFRNFKPSQFGASNVSGVISGWCNRCKSVIALASYLDKQRILHVHHAHFSPAKKMTPVGVNQLDASFLDYYSWSNEEDEANLPQQQSPTESYRPTSCSISSHQAKGYSPKNQQVKKSIFSIKDVPSAHSVIVSVSLEVEQQ